VSASAVTLRHAAGVAEVDPEMAVNIEHEDAAYSQTEGLALAAENLHSAAAAL
jgi:hypothetical protein